jgi:hypothetical protein
VRRKRRRHGHDRYAAEGTLSYTKVNWQNSPTATTPVGATRLGTMDQGIYDAHYPPLVAALPVSPIDGQLVQLAPAAFQSGTGPTPTYDPPILARYRAATAAAYHWECLSGIIERTQSPSPDTVSSVTYVAATGGTGPTGITIPFAGEWDIEIGVQLTGVSGSNAQQLYLSYDDGATAAVDADALLVFYAATAASGNYHRRYRRTFTAAGHVLTPKARTSNVLVTPTFIQWRIAAYPILIG